MEGYRDTHTSSLLEQLYSPAFIFSILTCLHVRKLGAEENKNKKKAIMKILLYHSVKMGIWFCTVRSSKQLSATAVKDRNGVVSFLVIDYIIGYATFHITALLTPILSLIILRPLREVLKLKMSCCSKQSPAIGPPEDTLVTEVPPTTEL